MGPWSRDFLWASVSRACKSPQILVGWLGPLCSMFYELVALYCIGNWGPHVLTPLLTRVTRGRVACCYRARRRVCGSVTAPCTSLRLRRISGRAP